MEIIFYTLFLLLFVYGAWLVISSMKKKKPMILLLPAHQDIYPGQIYPGEDELLQNSARQQQKPKSQGMTHANKERQRLEVEHKQILTEVLKEVLTPEPTTFDDIYSVYVERCTLQKRKPRGRDRVKAYLREMEQKGILNRVREGRQMIYSKVRGGDKRGDEPPFLSAK